MSWYTALVARSSSCVPRAAIRPSSSTTISSASAIVESRWAMISVVRFRIASRRPTRIRARDRQALPLAARERDAALADHAVVAIRQLVDEFARLRKGCDPLDLGV